MVYVNELPLSRGGARVVESSQESKLFFRSPALDNLREVNVSNRIFKRILPFVVMALGALVVLGGCSAGPVK
ncbi:MAG: hypothetical protein IPG26_05675 [Coprothermobacter sp.]|nr:hypothetical protein [Coprothermobacter sp.]